MTQWSIDVSWYDAVKLASGKRTYIPIDWRASGLDLT